MTPTTIVAAEAPETCCTPAESAVSAQEVVRMAAVFKAMGDPTRVRLLSLIAAGEQGEACVCDLTDPVGLSQSTVSHHMRILTEAGLVERAQRGKWAYYSVVRPALDDAAAALRAF
ncbi:ArsR/SmtB family transcription factor [Agrococcus beijingensis]|uniref:ArsR/SmtB family transcription factor n=1 Tax=Agrococcus beijingensis TaxID=3068634 RepID=UPI002741D4BB|nr:metalloregulator ArsR/SmtB family transcription factor [Agrococcus sp. REN33]